VGQAGYRGLVKDSLCAVVIDDGHLLCAQKARTEKNRSERERHAKGSFHRVPYGIPVNRRRHPIPSKINLPAERY
jgi:hypothetical protein